MINYLDTISADRPPTAQRPTAQRTTAGHTRARRARAQRPAADHLPASFPAAWPPFPSPVPLTRPSIGDAELAAVADVFDSGWMAGQGTRSLALEADFKKLSGRQHAVAVNDSTAGLHLALAGLGLGPGHEVIVADYSFPGTGHAVLYCGATPVFVDVRADTGTIAADLVEAAITSRTRAIVAVDALGMPADWAPLEQVAWHHGLLLIEDAACSAGGTYRGRPCGSFGEVAVFSLDARKGITCGEGGVVTTDDAALAARVRRDACFGMDSGPERQAAGAGHGTGTSAAVPGIGYSYQLSDVLAAVASVQLSKIGQFVARRRELAARYAELLADVPGILLPSVPPDRSPTWQTYAVTVQRPLSRDAVAAALRAHGIGCNIGTYALHRQGVRGNGAAPCPVSDELAERHLALPMYPDLTESDQIRVAGTLVKVISEQLACCDS